jgi:GntR family transcriptional regulator, transcriptional repressor for pyruvate dehydrogenase complex
MKGLFDHMFKHSDLNTSKKISSGVIEVIRDAILSGQVKPGDRLASEKELMAEFRVSKGSMREALGALEAMGLIEIRKGPSGGAYVTEVSTVTAVHGILDFLSFQSVSFKDVNLLRYMLEPTAAAIAASNITDEDIQKLEKIITETSIQDERQRYKGITFHLYLASMSKNPMLILIVNFIDHYLKLLRSRLGIRLDEEFYESVRNSHGLILQCLKERDPVASEIAMANDILMVDKYMSQKVGEPSLNLSDLQSQKDLVDYYLTLNAQAAIVPQGHSELKKPGVLARRVGSSDLYIVAQKLK